MTTTNKRLLISESRGNLNRCTPYKEKPNQHDMYASYASPRTSSVCFLRAVPVRGNLSRASWAVPLLLRKWAPDTIHSMPADQLMGPYPVSLPSQPMKQWWQSQASVDSRLVGLLSSYHQHAIGMFNTYSRGHTERTRWWISKEKYWTMDRVVLTGYTSIFRLQFFFLFTPVNSTPRLICLQSMICIVWQ
jgi:hypothetical protein